LRCLPRLQRRPACTAFIPRGPLGLAEPPIGQVPLGSPPPNAPHATPSANLPAVAIREFHTSVPEIAAGGATDMFVTAFLRTHGFQVLERARMNEGIAQEKPLNRRGLTTGTTGQTKYARAGLVFEATIGAATSASETHSVGISIGGPNANKTVPKIRWRSIYASSTSKAVLCSTPSISTGKSLPSRAEQVALHKHRDRPYARARECVHNRVGAERPDHFGAQREHGQFPARSDRGRSRGIGRSLRHNAMSGQGVDESLPFGRIHKERRNETQGLDIVGMDRPTVGYRQSWLSA
jgi:hypothetical protein